MLKTIKFLFLFIFLIIFSSSILLFSGIKIDSFSFGNFSVSQFYIKLNKKLIVNIDKITYKSKKSSVKNSFDDIKKNIRFLPKVLKFFERVNVERLIIDGNAFTISLNDKEIYLDNKFINFSSKFKFLSNTAVFDLYSLYLKDFEVLFEGKLKVDYLKGFINYFGAYHFKNISGNIKVDADEKIADFSLDSKIVKNIKFVKHFISLPKIAEDWMYKNVKGDIKLDEFYGQFDLDNLKLLEKGLRGKVSISNAKIRFHKDLKEVLAKKVRVLYSKNNLSFDLEDGKYIDVPLEGTNVKIKNLASSKNGQVDVHIKAKTRFTKDIQNILKAYKINLPLLQKSGQTKADLLLQIPYSKSKKLNVEGKFDIFDSNIAIGGFKFFSKKAEVLLHNDKVDIKNAHFKYKNMINSQVNLKLHTKTLKAKGNAYIKSFYIGNKETKILNIKNYKTNIFLELKNKIEIFLDKLKSKIKVKDKVYVQVDDLSILYPYSKLLKENSIKKGNISLSIKDENNLNFDANIAGLNFPIEKNKKKIRRLAINGKIDKGNLKIKSIDKAIQINKEKNSKINLKLKNIDINLKNSKDKKNKDFPLLKAQLLNSKLILDDDIFVFKKAFIDSNKRKIYFNARLKKPNIPLLKNNKPLEYLDVKGDYSLDETNVKTINDDLNLKIKGDAISLYVNGYDINYNSKEEEKSSQDDLYKNIDVKGEKSNIIINKKHKILADNYTVRIREKNKYLHLNYKKADITFKEDKNKNIDIFANSFDSEFINSALDKDIFTGGKFMLLANGKDKNIQGTLMIDNSVINNLGSLGKYKVKNANAKFDYNSKKESLKINKFITLGEGIDIDGKADIDLKNMTINSKIKVIFLKAYSSLLSSIPIVDYLFLGKDKRVETNITLSGKLDNPKVSTQVAKDTLSVPINIVKRILTSPIEFFKFLEEGLKEQNKPIKLKL